MKMRKGITLIELIISIAIMGIIAVVMLGIFDMGLININKAGKRTETVLSVKEDLDTNILTEGSGVAATITVILPGDISKEVLGRVIEINQVDAQGNSVLLRTFTTN